MTNHRHPTQAGQLQALALPPADVATLTDEWSEQRIALDPRLPADARLWRRRTADGYLTCLVARTSGGPRPYIVQLAHTAEPSPRPLPEGDPERDGRPPTSAEICDALNRFTPPQTPFSCIWLSAKYPAPAWTQSVTVVLSQIGPSLDAGKIQLL